MDKGKSGALAILIPHGKGGGPPPSDAEESGGDEGPGPDVEAAYSDYEDTPSAETLWRFVKACTKSYE